MSSCTEAARNRTRIWAIGKMSGWKNSSALLTYVKTKEFSGIKWSSDARKPSTLYAFVVAALATLSVRGQSTTFTPLTYAGVNIAGFDFGCGTDGTCDITQADPPLTQLGGSDGLGQMTHFINDDGYNIFRLPVGWQYLTDNVMTGTLNETMFANYNMLVAACLSTGAHCEIDIHNYARYDGEIIGQGGPSNEIFADLWYNIASYWKDESNVVFGVMNEPHDIPDIYTWAQSVQAAVTAIRTAGATSQIVLLPGNNYTSAETFVSSGSAEALNAVRNPDGTITNLVMDVHKYLDYDNSGTHAPCVTNNIADAWEPLSVWLRENGRQALNTETGGGDVTSCVAYVSQQIAYQAANSDVILGYLGWSAGSFATDYILSEVPTYNGTGWNDTLLVSAAMAPYVNGLVA
ncbi:glycoside hydrolase family 5 protein [Serpula lacrymans var. lacrymans S7.3]|uniref:cellulase n=2 Tax=Serpula lacrymans var. lacrymans TaxID=341189 RepID=F8PJ85_SERL3|nr:glycoside hydrolase family 5 protein [Serpula lacrymans var. lacrymans S7.9]EGO03449.1 glycoside hydrolase family 5 protein [Serpula lacrymans var. lacrymans S7.3]EGO29210.1 glycoside hydrolase family 5 protein [Serpula lacrymans var. lacrymans S7.9]